MARYCSPQLSVRTWLSPPYRATIRLKVFQGRNSISWAKSVLPVFIKASRDHPGSLRQLQIVDTALCPETRITPGVQSRRLSVNRTAVIYAGNGKCDTLNIDGDLDSVFGGQNNIIHFANGGGVGILSLQGC